MDKKEGIKNLFQLYISFFSIGLFTIGGGLAMIPLIEKIVVKDKKWLTEDEMIDCLAVSQSLPGVIGVNVATYIGNKKNGIKGSIFATLGVITPSLVIILLLASFLETIEVGKHIQGAFIGIKAAVCGLITITAYNVGKRTLKTPLQWTLGALSIISIVLFKITAIWVILGAAIVGIIITFFKKKRGNIK